MWPGIAHYQIHYFMINRITNHQSLKEVQIYALCTVFSVDIFLQLSTVLFKKGQLMFSYLYRHFFMPVTNGKKGREKLVNKLYMLEFILLK